MTKTIAVDFDGVIHTYERGWHDGSIYGEFMPGAVSGLSQLMSKYAVFILSTRKPRQIAHWIEDKTGHSIECTTWVPRSGFWNTQGVLLVTRRKLPAFAYLDDRGLRHVSWGQSLLSLAELERKLP